MLESIEYYRKYLQVRKSQISGAGYGVFTTIDIPANEPVCLYEGVLEPSELRDRESCYYVHVNKQTVLNATLIDTIGKLINDAYRSRYKTNVKFGKFYQDSRVSRYPYFTIRSKRLIKAGEELFLSYGSGFWNSFRRHHKAG